MKNYQITINGRSREVFASCARVAVGKALTGYKDADLDSSAITVRVGKTIKREWQLLAEIPCEPPGAFKRVRLEGFYKNKFEADQEKSRVRDQHPEYRYVGIVEAPYKKAAV